MTDYTKYPNRDEAIRSMSSEELARRIKAHQEAGNAYRDIVVMNGKSFSAAQFRALYDLADTFGPDARVTHNGYSTCIEVPQTYQEQVEAVTSNRQTEIWSMVLAAEEAEQEEQRKLAEGGSGVRHLLNSDPLYPDGL